VNEVSRVARDQRSLGPCERARSAREQRPQRAPRVEQVGAFLLFSRFCPKTSSRNTTPAADTKYIPPLSDACHTLRAIRATPARERPRRPETGARGRVNVCRGSDLTTKHLIDPPHRSVVPLPMVIEASTPTPTGRLPPCCGRKAAIAG